MNIAVVTDSTSDISKKLAEEKNINIVPLNVHFGLKTYLDGINIDSNTFYKRLLEGEILPTTSAPSAGTFIETYKKLSKTHDAIISIHVSSKTSATYSAALQASKEVDIPIKVIDSGFVSAGLAVVAIKVAEAVQSDKNLDEIASLTKSLISRTDIFFLLETIEYLVKGGRMGKARGLLGTLLKIKPILTFDEGEVNVAEKIRSSKKAIQKMHDLADLNGPYESAAIIYSTDQTEPLRLKNLLELNTSDKNILSLQLGPVVGTYGGPNVLGYAGIRSD